MVAKEHPPVDMVGWQVQSTLRLEGAVPLRKEGHAHRRQFADLPQPGLAHESPAGIEAMTATPSGQVSMVDAGGREA